MIEDLIETALRRYEPSGRRRGTHELVAGARRRAAQLRTRRRAGLAVLAVGLVGVPTGIGVNGGFPGTGAGVVASGAASQPREPARGPRVSGEQMIADSAVASVVAGVARQEDATLDAGSDVAAGLCVDEVFDASPLLGGRSVTWSNPGTHEGVRQTVLRFDGAGAATYVQFARDQADSCAVSAPETEPWTLVGDGSTGPDDLVTAWASAEEPTASELALYRVHAVVERDGVVVDVFADVRRTSPDEVSQTVADLAVGGLDAVFSGG